MKFFNNFRKNLWVRLAVDGFSSKGNFAWRYLNGVVVFIGVHRDARYCTKEISRFTIDIYISVDALRGQSGTKEPPFRGAMAFEAFHWNQRLGHMLPARNDKWWTIVDVDTSQAVCDEITASLRDIALPKVYELASSDALVSCWQKGHGAGLTEYGRRLILAKLLLVLGRVSEAQVAVQEFEDAAAEKSWGGTAAYDIKQLRQQLKSLGDAA